MPATTRSKKAQTTVGTGMSILGTGYDYWRKLTTIWSYIPGSALMIKVLCVSLLINYLLTNGHVHVPLLESAGIYTNLYVDRFEQPYTELNRFVKNFYSDQVQLTRIHDIRIRLLDARSSVKVMDFESRDRMFELFESSLETSYKVQRDHNGIIDLRYSLALRASAGYANSVRKFYIYQNSGLDVDRIAWFEALEASSDYLLKHLNTFFDHLIISLDNVDELDITIREVNLIKAHEGKVVGLQWPSGKSTRTVFSYIAWVIPDIFYQRRNHQVFLDELHITCTETGRYLQDQRSFVGNLEDQVENQNRLFKEMLPEFDGRYKDDDLIGLNNLAENGLRELKILMIQMDGHPEMLNKTGNTETMVAVKETKATGK